MTETPIPVFRPNLPSREKLQPYLERIDDTHWYTNRGPLAVEFESALASHYNCAPENVVVVANGTLALTAGLMALAPLKGCHCIMPSWTFAATPMAANLAGLIPYFADVSDDNWMLSPDTASALAREADVGAIIPVSFFGAPVDRAGWDGFTGETGIPVVIDAASGFDSIAEVTAAGPGSTPIMISLHATKVFGIGEGGLLLSTDEEFIGRVRRIINHGFAGTREASTFGLNAKLAEYGAAVGLAGLETWTEDRRAWGVLTKRFVRNLSALEGITATPAVGDGWVSSYGNAVLPAEVDIASVSDHLRRMKVDVRHWWGLGCHGQPAFADCPRAELPVTEALADRVIGLPFWLGLSDADFDHVFDALAEAMEESDLPR